MMQKVLDVFSRHKYKMGTFLLLSAASVVCLILVVARVTYSSSLRYSNLIWNLFLAWIPFVLAYLAYMLSWRPIMIYLIMPSFAFLWLIFFPNAPYILTDLQHLSQRASDVPIWYDVIMLIWFSWTGLLMGVVSLNLMQEIIKHRIGRWAGWGFVFFVAILSSVGIYIGRFIRLNSWDILQNPGQMAYNIWAWLSDPSLRSVGFIALYTLFFIFVYLTLYAFGHILQEGPNRV